MKTTILTPLHSSATIKTSLAAIFTALVLTSASHASTLKVSNLDRAYQDGAFLQNMTIYAPNFTTGDFDTDLHSIVLNVKLSMTQEQIDSGFTPSSLKTYLYKSDANGMPDLANASSFVAQDFTYDSGSLTPNLYTQLRFFAPQETTLEANTTYNFILHLVQDGKQSQSMYYFSVATVSQGYTSADVDGWDLNATLPFSADGGQTFINGAGNTNWYPHLAVHAVPEPSTYALIGAAAILGFVVIKRRMR